MTYELEPVPPARETYPTLGRIADSVTHSVAATELREALNELDYWRELARNHLLDLSSEEP